MNIIYMPQFKKSYKKLKKLHKDNIIKKLDETIRKLINLEITNQQANHKLNVRSNIKDIHISPNVILLYKYEGQSLILTLRLIDIVNHDELDYKIKNMKLEEKSLKDNMKLYKIKKPKDIIIRKNAGNVEQGIAMFNAATTINSGGGSGISGGMMENNNKKLPENFRVWGQEEIDNQNATVACVEAVKQVLYDNDIQFDEIKYDIFDIPGELNITGLYDIDKYEDYYIETIEDETGFLCRVEDNMLIVDITEEYEDEYGDIEYRVSTQYLNEDINKNLDPQYSSWDYLDMKEMAEDDAEDGNYPIDFARFMERLDDDGIPSAAAFELLGSRSMTNQIKITKRFYNYYKNCLNNLDESLNEELSNEYIKDYYIKEYPEDDLGQEIRDDITFDDLYNNLGKVVDIYTIIFKEDSLGDSIIRERLFDRLSQIKHIPYDDIYDKWQSVNDLAKTHIEGLIKPGDKFKNSMGKIIKVIEFTKDGDIQFIFTNGDDEIHLVKGMNNFKNLLEFNFYERI